MTDREINVFSDALLAAQRARAEWRDDPDIIAQGGNDRLRVYAEHKEAAALDYLNALIRHCPTPVNFIG